MRRARRNATLRRMSYFPVIVPGRRALRKQVIQDVLIELSAKGGKIISGKLQAISVNGGRAIVSSKHDEGTIANVRLHTNAGHITGVAQMLKSENVGGGMVQQAFRFLALEEEDYERLKAVLDAN
jgi:hypothetical protein